MDNLFLIYSFKNLQYSNKFHIYRSHDYRRDYENSISILLGGISSWKIYIFVVQFTNYSSAKFYSLANSCKHLSISQTCMQIPTFPKIQSSNIHLKVVGGYINLEQRLVKSSPHPPMQMKIHQLNSRTQRSEQKAAVLFFRRK